MRFLLSNPNQFKIKKDLLWVIMLTFATILVWISYSIYLAYNKSTLDEEVISLLEPLDPSLDEVALDILANQIEVPSEFTILVQRESGDATVIMPLDQNVGFTNTDTQEISTSQAAEIEFETETATTSTAAFEE